MRFFWVGRFGLDVSPGLPLTTTHPARGDDLHHRGRLGSETTAAPRWGAETWNRKTDKNGDFLGFLYRDSLGGRKPNTNGILGDYTCPSYMGIIINPLEVIIS